MDHRHSMSLRQPATRWQDALPSGNGLVGALVYGMIRNELVVLNHEDLWFRRPIGDVPDVSEHLPVLKKMIADGHYPEAASFRRQLRADGGRDRNAALLQTGSDQAFAGFAFGLAYRKGGGAPLSGRDQGLHRLEPAGRTVARLSALTNGAGGYR